MNRPPVFLFWAVMDLLAFSGFIVAGLKAKRVPFYDDTQEFIRLNIDHGWYAGLVFGCSMALYFSLLLSTFLFFKGSRLAKPVAYLQIPFRLLLAVPSVTVFTWLAVAFGLTSALAIISLKIASELIKFITLSFGFRSSTPLYP